MDIASQIYIVCAAIGSIYLIAGLIMGQLHGHGDAGAAQGDHGLGHIHGDAGIGHGLGHGHGAGIGHGPAIGHGHGDPAVGHGHGTTHAHDGSTADSSNQGTGSAGISRHLEPHVDISTTGAQHMLAGHHHADHGPVQLMERKRFKVMRFLQTILSPMTIAVFLAYFGIAGLILARVLPVLGPFNMIVAAILSLLITGRVLQLLRWMVFKMNVSTVTRLTDMIGHQAEVITPIRGERLGEVMYWTGSTRMQSPAKAATPATEFKSGDKVMICDIREGIAYVEPWDDISLDESAVVETKDKLKEQQDA